MTRHSSSFRSFDFLPGHWVIPLIALLMVWMTRIASLESLPLHNDEGLHLTRAVEVWNGHPFWNISDGKIINHWLIAALFPQNAPVFTGRIATLLITMMGFAAAFALARSISGAAGGLLMAALWTASPYLFFYERTALSDAEAGALVVVSFYFALRAGWRHDRLVDAALAGLGLAAAVLFKFTAAPFALGVGIIIFRSGHVPLRHRLIHAAVIFGIAALCFVPPVLYLLLRGRDFFSIALGWIGVSGAGSQGLALSSNAARLWELLTGYGTPLWTVALLSGLVALIGSNSSRRIAVTLLSAAGLPLIIIMVFGREVLPRHYIAALPLVLALGGAGLGVLATALNNMRGQRLFCILVVLVLGAAATPFMLTAYRSPGSLPLPEEDRAQFVGDHSSGFGLREAVQSFSATLTRSDVPVVASMFPDSCRRANFYAAGESTMICTDAPGLASIETILKNQGRVYVLVDNAPLIGVDVTTISARIRITRVANYPRPGETESEASVVLWFLEQ